MFEVASFLRAVVYNKSFIGYHVPSLITKTNVFHSKTAVNELLVIHFHCLD